MTATAHKLARIVYLALKHGGRARATYLVFQLAEVAVPRQVFAAMVKRIGRLRLACASG